MSVKTFKQRLEESAAVLKSVEKQLQKFPSTLPKSVQEVFEDISGAGHQIDAWVGTLKARNAAEAALDRLDGEVDPSSGRVKYLGEEIDFALARLLTTHGFLSIAWALADSITGVAGMIVCTESVTKNRKGAKLIPDFIQLKPTVGGSLSLSLREWFGWPAGISYAIRNHFVHDGGHRDHWQFFKPATTGPGFEVTQEGWDYVVQKLARESYKLDPALTRSLELPSSPPNDLRKTLKICHREMDEALGILLSSACESFKVLVAHLLGEV